MTTYLTEKKCVACEGGVAPLSRAEAETVLREIPGWQLNENATELSQTFKTSNFSESLTLANRIGALAEQEGHHPDLTVSWGALTVRLSTHSIGGLSENDFILAAKITALRTPA